MSKLTKLLILVSYITWSQAEKKTYTFSLEQAINHGLQYNKDAQNAGKDIAISKQKKWETTAIGLPQINANVGYQNNIVIQRQVVPAEFFGGNPGEFAEVAFGVKHNVIANASLTQLLFDGSYLVALQASKVYLQFFENAKKKTDTEIKEQIIISYGNVLLAEENLTILEKNKASIEKTLYETNETFKNGLIEEENVEQLKITLSSINNNLGYIKRLKDISYTLLKINLGLEIIDDLTLSDKLEDLTNTTIASSLKANDFNVTNTIDYAIVSNLVSQRSLELKLEKSKALPSLGAQFNFGYNAFNNQFQFFNAEQRWLNFTNVGLNLNIPIFSSFGREAKTQQAKIALDKARNTQKDVEQKLLLQFQKAKSDLDFSVEQYSSSKENLRLSERIESKQQIKFKEGLSSSFEFTDAQRQLYAAQQSYLQSMIEVITKRAALEKILTQ